MDELQTVKGTFKLRARQPKGFPFKIRSIAFVSEDGSEMIPFVFDNIQNDDPSKRKGFVDLTLKPLVNKNVTIKDASVYVSQLKTPEGKPIIMLMFRSLSNITVLPKPAKKTQPKVSGPV